VLGLGAYLVLLNAQGRTPDRTAEVVTLETRVAEDPGDLEARLALAFAYQRSGQYPEAIESYNVVVAGEPTNVGALYNRGVCLAETGDETGSAKSFSAVLKVAPEHVLAAQALGEHYRDKELYAEMVGAVEPAAEANPEIADLQALLGLAYEKTGRPDDAAREYRQALRYAPGLTLAVEGLDRVESPEE
jgi:tetratricopeptide (TPR) repeat protein